MTTNRMTPAVEETVRHLRSLPSIRERVEKVFQRLDRLNYFQVDLSQLPLVVQRVLDLIQRDYTSPAQVPPHSRWRHFNVGGRQRIQLWRETADFVKLNVEEQTRTVLDLFVVSVLLDAGAGDQWTYLEPPTSERFGRSEGLAVASFHLFLEGAFSSQPETHPWRADALGLRQLTVERLRQGMQVSAENPMVGLEGRCQLLNRLGEALDSQPIYFPRSASNLSRPGCLLDYLLSEIQTSKQLPVEILWRAVIEGFQHVWPATRTRLGDIAMGDVWPCDCLPLEHGDPTTQWVPFHKLSQWLTYSLMEPLQVFLGIQVQHLHLMTGLPEYRNGGLFVDLKVLLLKEEAKQRGLAYARSKGSNDSPPGEEVPLFVPSDPVIIEWRALTVALLDRVGMQVRSALKLSEEELPLVKVLEAGTWKAGREVAAEKRPRTRGPPIQIDSDGTVF